MDKYYIDLELIREDGKGKDCEEKAIFTRFSSLEKTETCYYEVKKIINEHLKKDLIERGYTNEQ